MFEEKITVGEKDVFEVNVECIDDDEDQLEETIQETWISEDKESETLLWGDDSESDEGPDMVSDADFTYEGETTQDVEERQESWVNREGIDRVTLHAADLEVLARFTAQIQEHLRCGNQALALAGIELCKAKQALGRGEALSDEQELTFTEWYQQELNLSPDRARRLMRWVRPVTECGDDSASADLILKELVEIGPCLFDEVQKLPDDCWYFDYNGQLYISSEVTGTDDIADMRVCGMSVREVREIQRQYNNPNYIADSRTQDGPHSGTTQEEEQVDEYVPDELESEQMDDFDDDGDADSEDMADEAADGDRNQSGTETVFQAEKKKSAHETRIDLSQTDPDLWIYGTSEVEKITIVNGKLNASDAEQGMKVYGVNVQFSSTGNGVTPAVINLTEDAFYVLKDDASKTVHWFEHETRTWQSAQIVLGSEQ